jgi:hypothetical protein
LCPTPVGFFVREWIACAATYFRVARLTLTVNRRLLAFEAIQATPVGSSGRDCPRAFFAMTGNRHGRCKEPAAAVSSNYPCCCPRESITLPACRGSRRALCSVASPAGPCSRRPSPLAGRSPNDTSGLFHAQTAGTLLAQNILLNGVSLLLAPPRWSALGLPRRGLWCICKTPRGSTDSAGCFLVG